MTDDTATTKEAPPAVAELDAARTEIAQLLALHTLSHPAQIGPTVDMFDPAWRILFLKIADRWWVWHIAPTHVPLFGHVHQIDATESRRLYDAAIDGKYDAIAEHVAAHAGRSEAQLLRTTALGMARDVVRDLENLDVDKYADHVDALAIRAACLSVTGAQTLLHSITFRERYTTLDTEAYTKVNRNAGMRLLDNAYRHAAQANGHDCDAPTEAATTDA